MLNLNLKILRSIKEGHITLDRLFENNRKEVASIVLDSLKSGGFIVEKYSRENKDKSYEITLKGLSVLEYFREF